MKRRTTVAGVLAVTVLVLLRVGAAGQSRAIASDEALALAHQLGLQVREGRHDGIAAAVKVLEGATTADPTNSELWTAMGIVYALQGTAVFATGDFAAGFIVMQRSAAAMERALAINPADPLALSAHGMGLTIAGAMQKRPDIVERGVVEMDRAVELAPKLNQPRLNRAFTHLNLPQGIRRTDTVMADLTFLQRAANGTRAADMLRILIGDMHAEAGRVDAAREQYEGASHATSKVLETARPRLAALATGAVSSVEIGRLREGLATNCAMCHAR